MAMRSVMAILMAAMSVLAFGQVRISVGPLVITPPSGYALSAQQKSDRVTFTSASPALQVIVSFGSLRGEDSWAALEHHGQRQAVPLDDTRRSRLGAGAIPTVGDRVRTGEFEARPGSAEDLDEGRQIRA
ncbi:MAG: hypothetical protein DCC45_09355 [Armatimonadetes bacterium]|nr:MAG: hypothetical protein DCC45_09355 [Armatimonadota bacterium]